MNTSSDITLRFEKFPRHFIFNWQKTLESRIQAGMFHANRNNPGGARSLRKLEHLALYRSTSH